MTIPRTERNAFSMLSILFCLLLLPAASSAQQLFPDVSNNSIPRDTQTGIDLQKGRRGLAYTFQCIDAMNNPSLACFPLGHYDVAGKLVSIGGSSSAVTLSVAASPCTVGSSPAPGACSYVVLDRFGRGNLCHSPVPGDPNPEKYSCADTVEIFFNGNFPNNSQVQETVVKAVGNEAGSNVTQLDCPGASPCTLAFKTSSSTTPAPVSLELAFDISGSMSCSTTSSTCPAGGGELQRMQALQGAAQVFFSTLSSYAIAGDKVGVSFFSTTATPDPNGNPACSSTNLLGADTPSNITTLASKVSAQVPTNATSIGAGLQSANACGFALDLSGNMKKEVLLFSDGEQNTAPNVQVVGSSPPQLQISNVAGNVFGNYDSSIRVCPVTAGRLTAVGYNLQQRIADAACGSINAHIRDTNQNFAAADLETFFAQSLAVILPTDKLELVVDTSGTLAPGQTATEKYLGNLGDVKTSIALSWAGVIRDRIPSLRLRAPDGTLVDLADRTQSNLNHTFTSITFPLYVNGLPVGQKGEWTIELDGTKLASTSGNYHLLVMSDNSRIASEFRLDAQNVGTGDPVPIRVMLTDNGAPVLNATVQAQLAGPQNSLGNVLSTTPAQIGPPTGPDPASTKGQAKLDALLANPATASLFADQSLPTLSLLDNGSSANGDTAANDGLYSGLFKDTAKEGHYYFAIRVRGSSAKAGDFERTFRVTEFARAIATDAQTNWQVVSSIPQLNGSTFVTLSVTPHDAHGNFIGPGYEKDLIITSSIGTIQTALTDNLDGSYQITYQLPSVNSNPIIGVVILGVPVKSGPLSGIPGASTGLGSGLGPINGKWAASFHLGATIPHGALSAYSSSISVGGDLEYALSHGVSLETYLGFDHFRSSVGNQHFLNVSERGKWTYSSGKLRPFAFFGAGGYFASGGSNHAGINTGAGLQYWFAPRFAVDGTYTFHNVFVSGGNARYSTVLGGVRYVFK